MSTAKRAQEPCVQSLPLPCDTFAPNLQYTSTLGKAGWTPPHINTLTMLLTCSKQVILSKVRGTLFTTHVLLVSKCEEELPITLQYHLQEDTTASALQLEEKLGSGYDPVAKVLPGVFALRNSTYCTHQLHFCLCGKEVIQCDGPVPVAIRIVGEFSNHKFKIMVPDVSRN